MSAPPSRSVMARFAVSVVTCRHAAIRIPFSGWFLMKSLRMDCSTGMDWFAHSMRFLPWSASSMFLTSPRSSVVDAVAMDSFLVERAFVVMKTCVFLRLDKGRLYFSGKGTRHTVSLFWFHWVPRTGTEYWVPSTGYRVLGTEY